jgi:predicted dehydrogenase
MASELSICILGTGHIARKHVRLLRAVAPGVHLSVASRELGRAQAFQHDLALEAAHGSYSQALDSGCRAVLIATPPRIHFELFAAALARGKQVVLEKPAFNDLTEFQRARALAAQARATVLVAENLHFAPFHRRVKALLREHDWGAPVLLDLVRFGRARVSGWRADPAEMPLGALHEGGVHWVRRLLDLAGVFEPAPLEQIESLRACAPARRFNANPGEDTVIVNARHRSGLVSRLVHSWGLPWRNLGADRSRLVAERGTVYFDSRSIFGRAVGAKSCFLFPSLFDGGGYKAMWRHFARCLAGEVEPELPLEVLHHDFAYVDAAYRSLQSGREEPLRFTP